MIMINMKMTIAMVLLRMYNHILLYDFNYANVALRTV